MQCPKCGFEQSETTECARCGIVFSRVRDQERAPAANQWNRPSTCAHCGFNASSQEIAGASFCDPCAAFLRNRPFPGWIKLAAAVTVLLVVVSFVRNQRYVEALFELNRAMVLFGAGDVAASDSLMAAARSHAPESNDVQMIGALVHGVKLIQEDQPKEALASLRSCSTYFEGDEVYKEALLHAEMGSAFDSGDYDLFLKKAQEGVAAFPSDPMMMASVASGYACKFAVTGDPKYEAATNEWLAKARALSQEGEAFAEYEARIRYRLTTRQIIDRSEYLERTALETKEKS